MESWISAFAQHGYAILFAIVFLEAVGLPVPAALALLIAGGAAANGTLGVSYALCGAILAMLEGDGSAIRGRFDPGVDADQWCARRLLVRIHSYTQQRLRREIEPVTAQDFMRFLLRWQRVAPGTQREGRAGVAATIAQLQGFEIPAGVGEESVLPSRVSGYRSAWLDELCMSGEVAWARLKVRDDPDAASAQRSSASASRATPG